MLKSLSRSDDGVQVTLSLGFAESEVLHVRMGTKKNTSTCVPQTDFRWKESVAFDVSHR